MRFFLTRRSKNCLKTFLKGGIIALLLPLLAISLPLFSSPAHASTRHVAYTETDSYHCIRTSNHLGGFGPGIWMMSKDIGWTVGSSGLMRSSDGGETWQVVARRNPQEPMDQSYVLDEQTAWYSTFDPQTFETVAVYRTDDGGQSWTRFPFSGLLPLQLKDLSIIDHQFTVVQMADFTDSDVHLYLVGGSPGWQEFSAPVPGVFGNLFFLSPLVGWETIYSTDLSSDLYATHDGGQSWTLLQLPRPEGVASDAPFGFIQPLGFANPLQGYLEVAFQDLQTGNLSFYIYRTLDGGQSWIPSASPAPGGHVIQIDGWYLTNPFFLHALNVGDSLPLNSLLSDQWQTTSITLPTQPQWERDGNLVSPLDQRVFFLSFPTGHSLDLYKTTNGGKNWRKVFSFV